MSEPLSAWSWSSHACRSCLGRLVRRDAPGGGDPVFECGNCTHTAKGSPDAICGCGVLPKPAAAAAGKADPGAPRFRCVPNPARSVASPAAVVIQWGTGA